MAQDGILLESGTNEVEVLEFSLRDQSFGVNVLKIQAIEQYDPERVTRIQLSHPSIAGTLLFREECITLVDLRTEMDTTPGGGDEPADDSGRLVLVMEFNNLKTAFLVDGVNRIHRVSWGAIQPLSTVLDTTDSKFTGSLQIEDREILIVDLEKIVADIIPGQQGRDGNDVDANDPARGNRGTKIVFLAEDSAVVRETVENELGRDNYADVHVFANGLECWEEICRLRQEARDEGGLITDFVDVLVTDIEMPAMDGLALCKGVKSDPELKDLPVIIFSSLINEQIARKCEDVSADAYITKPQFRELVGLLDRFTCAAV